MAENSLVYNDLIDVEELDALCISLQTTTLSKYPAKQHARSVAKHLGVKSGLVYLLGTPSRNLEDSDQPQTFRQRRFFYYISGVDFEDCIVTYDIERDNLRLFIPPAFPWEVIWLGPTPSIKECQEKYDVDHVSITGEAHDYILDWSNRSPKSPIYILHEEQAPKMINLDCRNTQITKVKSLLNWTHLQPAMEAARVIKSDHEVELIRRANDITSYAHRYVLSSLRKRYMDNETQIEAAFQRSCLWKGAKKQAYEIIAGSGTNASTLHYVANNQPLEGRQLVCLDAGCEWECYASDVTRTFPISGTFSDEAKEIYDIVEEMQFQCIKRIKPGVIFRDLHRLAMEIAVAGLIKLGVLHNGTFEEMLPTGVAFFPHGLGHHLGLECHDVQDFQRLLLDVNSIHDLPGKKSYSSARTKNLASTTSSKPYDKRQVLQVNMVITVEPGIYFSRYALEQVYLKDPKHAKYINKDLLERYYPIGGIRIEDDILVTTTGYENLTTAPKGEEACRIIRGDDARPPPPAYTPQASPAEVPAAMYTPTTGESSKDPKDAEFEASFSAYHASIQRYLSWSLKGEKGPPGPNRAREKLAKLSLWQIQELSIDVVDEIHRRKAVALATSASASFSSSHKDEGKKWDGKSSETPSSRKAPEAKEREEKEEKASVPAFLAPIPTYHPKRNQARQRLSTLPASRFADLITDVKYNLERRYPHFAERNTAETETFEKEG